MNRDFTKQKGYSSQKLLLAEEKMAQIEVVYVFLAFSIAAVPSLGYVYPQGVRQKFVGIRQIFVNLRFTLMAKKINLFTTHRGTRDLFFLLGGTRSERVWEPLLYRMNQLYLQIFFIRSWIIISSTFGTIYELAFSKTPCQRCRHELQLLMRFDYNLQTFQLID